jgi:hypothetical protein
MPSSIHGERLGSRIKSATLNRPADKTLTQRNTTMAMKKKAKKKKAMKKS